jgi:putative transposase
VSGPRPPKVELGETEEQALRRLVRCGNMRQKIVRRARIVLAAAAGLNNAEVSRQLGMDVDTVRTWRGRWLAKQAISLEDLSAEDRLDDEPRSGAPRRILDEQVCQIVALACELPEESGRPISQWTAHEIADEIKRRGIVDEISDRHAMTLLKRGISNRTAGATG